ncbi:hypothetical protein DM759_25350 [Salmonella enterica]|nr:hypothetical protein [Salmonella enterica]EAM9129374.1 hypothetical protein [Salmonella enterica]EAP0601234.1 hypothetical protein [Salmonella enterica]EAS2391110.1 hypothetical protein [Salmonella enterica]EAS2419021.1 hypothetical protein [Salmonella enterica]
MCGGQWLLDQNAYGQNAGYCHGCAVAAVPEREKSKAMHTLSVQVNRAMYSVMHSSVMRSGTDKVLPRNAAEWYALKDLVEKLTLMNEQERMMRTGIRWELGHIYPASGAGYGDVYRGVCRVENLSIIESRRNREEGNQRPDEWLPVQVIPYNELQAILKNHEASRALKARKEAIIGRMTPEQKDNFDKKIKALDDKQRELTRNILSSESHQLELLLNSILTPYFSDYLQEMANKLEVLEYRTSKTIDGLIQSGRAEESFIQHREKRLMVSSFIDGNARLRVVVQTLQRIEDAHEAAAEAAGYEESEWYTLEKAAVLWAQEVMKAERVQVMGFSHPLLKNMNGHLWGVSVASNGEQYLCVWEDEPEPESTITADGEKPFDSNEWEGWEQRKKLVSVVGDGWQRCVDVFLYERAKDKAAREAARATQEREKAQAIQRQHDKVLALLVDCQTLKQRYAEDKARLMQEALNYYQSEFSTTTPRSFFISELSTMLDEYQVDSEQVDRVIDACQEYLSWQYDTPESAQKAAGEVVGLSVGYPALPVSLRIVEPFGGGVWLNTADRAEQRRRMEAHQRAEAERAKAAESRNAEKVEREKKAAFMKSPAGQAWLAQKKGQSRRTAR